MTVYRRGLAFYVHLFVTESKPAQWPVGTGLQREEWLSINTKWHYPLRHIFFFFPNRLSEMIERKVDWTAFVKRHPLRLLKYSSQCNNSRWLLKKKITGSVFSLNFRGTALSETPALWFGINQ